MTHPTCPDCEYRHHPDADCINILRTALFEMAEKLAGARTALEVEHNASIKMQGDMSARMAVLEDENAHLRARMDRLENRWMSSKAPAVEVTL